MGASLPPLLATAAWVLAAPAGALLLYGGWRHLFGLVSGIPASWGNTRTRSIGLASLAAAAITTGASCTYESLHPIGRGAERAVEVWTNALAAGVCLVFLVLCTVAACRPARAARRLETMGKLPLVIVGVSVVWIVQWAGIGLLFDGFEAMRQLVAPHRP